MDQKAVDETIGPRALARAPSDLKMPSTVPFWSKFPYLAVRVVMHVTQKAVAVGKHNKANKVSTHYSSAALLTDGEQYHSDIKPENAVAEADDDERRHDKNQSQHC